MSLSAPFSGAAAALPFGFELPRPAVQAAFLTSDLFLVVANAAELGILASSQPATAGEGEPRFHNTLAFDGWTLAAQVGQTNAYGDYSNVMIFKGRPCRLADLVSSPRAWTEARTFAAPSVIEPTAEAPASVSAPDPAQLVLLAKWLQEYLAEAATTAAPSSSNSTILSRTRPGPGFSS